MTSEEIDARLARWVEAWRSAHTHCAAITDEKARHHAVKVADELLAEGVRECLRPLFKAARKHKGHKDHKEHKGHKEHKEHHKDHKEHHKDHKEHKALK